MARRITDSAFASRPQVGELLSGEVQPVRTVIRALVLLEPMKKMARMLRAHEPLLMNWFRARGELSSAPSKASTTNAE
jgi:hypothetical protein